MVISAPPRIPQASAAVAAQLAPAGAGTGPGGGTGPGAGAGPGGAAWLTAGDVAWAGSGGAGTPGPGGPGTLPGLWMMALAHRLTRAGANALNRTPSATSVNSGPDDVQGPDSGPDPAPAMS
jgi:hypothetical protein